MHAAQRFLAIEIKASKRSDPRTARPLREVLETVHLPGLEPNARHLALVVTRGREIELLAPQVWAIPDWRLFGPARESADMIH
jgi:hypothetical protein